MNRVRKKEYSQCNKDLKIPMTAKKKSKYERKRGKMIWHISEF